MLRWIPLLALFGCGAKVADEMELALMIANDAVAIALLSAEPAAWYDATDSGPSGGSGGSGGTGGSGGSGATPTPAGARHGAAGDCPRLDRTPDEGSPWTVEADYKTGCVSGSGLIPTILSGPLMLAAADDLVQADFDTLTVSLARVATGSWAGMPTGDDRFDFTGTLSLPEAERHRAIAAEVQLVVAFDEEAERTTIDGAMSLDRHDGPVEVRFDGVRLRSSDIPGECPNPNKGVLTVLGSPDRTVDFGEPGNGQVTVMRKQRTSQPARLCSFAADVF